MTAPRSNGPNPWKDVQSILAFLLAGFASILGFLGLGATQIFTFFRNAPSQASFIALMFLLSIIAAVLGALISHDEELSWRWVFAIFPLLLATVSWMVYESNAGSISPIVDVALGAITLGTVIFAIVHRKKTWNVPAQLICILASVVLLATSVYGAILLGSQSLRPPSVQISANIISKTPHTTIAIHVTAFNISMNSHVEITTLGCIYLSQCEQIFSATVPGDASGSIDRTMIDGLILDDYQDISVGGKVCESAKSCVTSDRYVVHLNIRLSGIPSPQSSDKTPKARS
jgi:hypothetical protein